MPLLSRVLIINADRYRKPRILDLLGLRNDYVIVCGQIRSMHQWGHYSHPEATIKCLVSPEGESATDTTLMFHAGTLLATNPRLRHVPWLIVTQDRTLKSLLACLQHRKVRTLGLLPLYEGGLSAFRPIRERMSLLSILSSKPRYHERNAAYGQGARQPSWDMSLIGSSVSRACHIQSKGRPCERPLKLSRAAYPESFMRP